MIVDLEDLLKRVDVIVVASYKDYMILHDSLFQYYFQGVECFYIDKYVEDKKWIKTKKKYKKNILNL